MATSFLTSLNEDEFKNFLKKSLAEILPELLSDARKSLPDILDIKQAAEFLKLKINTLYEKTSRRLVPFFKKGNKLYFRKDELQQWIQNGKVKTQDEIQSEAASYSLLKNKGK
jgi:excisionase family DNA binding protein